MSGIRSKQLRTFHGRKVLRTFTRIYSDLVRIKNRSNGKNILVTSPLVTLDRCPCVKRLEVAKDTAQWWICLMTDNNSSSRSLLDPMTEHQFLKEDPRHIVGYCP
jgi:hypothetical protein